MKMNNDQLYNYFKTNVIYDGRNCDYFPYGCYTIHFNGTLLIDKDEKGLLNKMKQLNRKGQTR